MKRILGFGVLLVVPFLVAMAVSVSAAQPKEDSIVLDKDGCSVEVRWVDGMETATKATISLDGIVKQTITLDDIVGDQSTVLSTVTAPEGTSIRGRLYAGNEIIDEMTALITKCPTPTATATATATSVPATATPVPPTATAVPPTPIVIVQAVEVPVIRVVPPSTGDGGLLQ